MIAPWKLLIVSGARRAGIDGGQDYLLQIVSLLTD
jgi:hypothetical protein